MRSPIVASILLLLTIFLRLPLNTAAGMPFEPWWMALALLIASTALWMDRSRKQLRGIGAVEIAMGAYLLWNVHSMLAPHKYPALDVLTGESIPVARFIVIGTLIPFVFYIVGRYAFDRLAAVNVLLWTILAFAAYSAALSIMPFTGLSAYVWPSHVIENVPPGWEGRAVGIFVQPVVNGMVLTLGFAVAMLLMSRRDEPTWRKIVAFLVAAACGWGIYLTHTRAVWLSAAVVLIIGALLAKGFRRGFVAVLGLVAVVIATNWSVFTSSDRESGGVASAGEVENRLNNLQTAFWAFVREPVQGWGIARFQVLNTYHHQQWAADVPWVRGLSDVSHENEIGILAELGLIGFLGWVCVLVLIAYKLRKAYRSLPDNDLCGKPLAVIAIMAFAILLCTGFTVDLRYFDFSMGVIFLLAGTAIGWSERGGVSRDAVDGEVAEKSPVTHG
ncbi:MAG TPA: O-antigen ligase family protein [Mycobacterium sp.]|nr:O-antigen ligase family protein [Mycobacterium sp.]